MLLQKVTAILLQNTLGFLLQNATVLLQNATVITNFNDFITTCDSYYQMQRLLQILTLHSLPNSRCSIMVHYAKACVSLLDFPYQLVNLRYSIGFSLRA